MLLSNRVAIVTGGSSGIGRGIAIELAREGAKVAVADVQQAPKIGKYHETDLATTTVDEIEKLDGEGCFVKTDVSDELQVRNMIEQTYQRFGGLDILVNNAGIHIPGDSQALSLANWDKVTGLNQRGVFMASKLAVENLRNSRAGRIINIASIQAFRGGGGPAYPTAKAAVVNLTRSMAVELASDAITVNAVCPGYIETSIQDYASLEQIEVCRQKTLLPRFGKPRDVARACVFLASNDAEWITGTALVVDGGWLAGLM